ncbi:LacI family DNA-binding transcriptional regulator [Lysobacter sp. K5869]|uniref:LacI family DNA-binding transcriptional regulator n=1 Tax=Lysobacter sp. K5869 TaxID=2820808 RepID=UPI001C06425C|nr:LacI family DNA-binding transcriptional regulator [Lysobacter sp. K5869]QWP75293.1 LacI family DNA-binding transcriptional regulator [Lysobacter sp. K5869]
MENTKPARASGFPYFSALGAPSGVEEIARRTDVSVKTVMRVMQRSPLVSVDTRNRVLASMRELGWSFPSARAVQRPALVGLVYDNPSAQYVVDVQRSVLAALNETGVGLVVHPCDSGRSDYVEGVRRFALRHGLSGLLLIPRVSEDELLATALREAGCCYVRVASIPLDDPARTVLTRDRKAGAEAARHLLTLGHRHFGVIAGPRRYRSSIERVEGFVQVLFEAGLGPSALEVYQGSYTFESGIAGAEYLLAQRPRPTAIFACNDEMASGCYHVALRRGLAIPEDLSMVGYDDSPIAAQLSPGLTSVHLPVDEVGQLAVRSLLHGLGWRTGGVVAREAAVTPRLTVRDSTRSPAVAEATG